MGVSEPLVLRACQTSCTLFQCTRYSSRASHFHGLVNGDVNGSRILITTPTCVILRARHGYTDVCYPRIVV